MEGESYILNNDNSTQIDFNGGSANYTFLEEEEFGQFKTNATYFGTVTFDRFDTFNNIMSGTFEFQAQEITTGKIITITDGRFDLTFTN